MRPRLRRHLAHSASEGVASGSQTQLNRRSLVCGAASLLLPACSPRTSPAPARAPDPETSTQALQRIEALIGGRLGLFALDTATGQTLEHRPDERFAMCSTFKWVLVAAVLTRVERGELTLAQQVAYAESDLLEYAPVTRANVGAGQLGVEALAEAAITVSDNTAANLLLSLVGGPSGLTEFIRAQGDSVTRLDRDEPMLNTNLPGDSRDTTSPRAMLTLMQTLLLGPSLSGSSRGRILGWLRECKTGHERLRAGLPRTWNPGDKTGTGNNGAVSDIAIATPPGRAPILIASYISESRRVLARLNAAHAEIGRVVATRLRGG